MTESNNTYKITKKEEIDRTLDIADVILNGTCDHLSKHNTKDDACIEEGILAILIAGTTLFRMAFCDGICDKKPDKLKDCIRNYINTAVELSTGYIDTIEDEKGKWKNL